MAEGARSNAIEYHAISPKADTEGITHDSVELGTIEGQPQLKSLNRSWASTIALQVVSLLWLAPIGVLLYLNAVEFVIGSSAWCPLGECDFNIFNLTAPQRAYQLAAHDRNLLGGLQFVAKAIEAWFVFICGALLYLVTMASASRLEGLPIGYLTKSMSFALPVGLAHSIPLLKPSGSEHKWRDRSVGLGHGLWLLVMLSGMIFALCSLMGPATAVLVLPVLQWIDAPMSDVQNLTSINNELAPLSSNDSWFWRSTTHCNASEYDALTFTCAQNPYGDYLDAWLTNYNLPNGGVTGLATQGGMTFQLNSTDWSGKENVKNTDAVLAWWVPSRQVVDKLGHDLQNLSSITHQLDRTRSERVNRTDVQVNMTTLQQDLGPAYDDYYPYTKALDLEVRRNGPILGAVANWYLDYDTLPRRVVITVDDHREVICYLGYTLERLDLAGDTRATYTKCIRDGGGWGVNATNRSTWRRFSIPGRSDGSRGPPAYATVISSDKTVFLRNGEVQAGFDAACLDLGSDVVKSDCDWERLFDSESDSLTKGRTSNMVTIEYRLTTTHPGSTTNSTTYSTVLFAVDFAAYRGNTIYSVAASPTQNPARLVRTEDLPDVSNMEPILVEPAWILAGWAADDDGSVNPWRPTSNLLLYVLEGLLAHKDEGFAWFANDTERPIEAIAVVPIMQSLSLIDHGTKAWNGSPTSLDRNNIDPGILYRDARMFVWAYGYNSRTSRFGAVVAVAGCVLVIAQVLLGFYDRRRYRTATQLLVAALEHTPQGEFLGRDHKESALATAEFRVVDDHTRAGKLSFHALR
ncbi:hypothetical protein LTR17_019381 [Elasticomyces elasticus]|nr:hypothetical protein LTR17_019381 [Elasticomyces elasticus]